jgi:hypothetical protein
LEIEQMKSIHEFANQELLWVQPKALQRTYELRAGDDVVATLRWEKAWGSLVTAVTAKRQWTFKRVGFLHPRVTIRQAGSESDLALVELRWHGGGDVQFANGRRFHWRNTSFWRGEWAFITLEGEKLIQFKHRFSLTKMKGHVEIEAGARALPELSLLAALGWYLMGLMSEDAAATTIIVSSAST